jgi:nucleotide-binding universal stress UspA family protein
MFRNVLVATDASPLSQKAIPWALAAAGPNGAIHLVHVHEYLTPMAVEGMVMTGPADDLARREAEEAMLARLASQVQAAAHKVVVTTRNVDPDGPLVDGFTEAAAATGSELVVIATHGRGPFARFWAGSVADELLKYSRIPVLFIRPTEPNAPVDLSQRPALKRILVALDGSHLAETIIDPTIRLGAVFQADFELVMVVDALTDPDAIARIAQPDLAGVRTPLTPAERGGLYLDRIAKQFTERMAVAKRRLLKEGEAVEAILRVASDDPTTAIAVATHGRSGISRMLKGSVADELIRRAAGPVLAFHPPD